MPSDDASGDFTVFISYAHSDNENADPNKCWLNRLLEHLQPLVFQKQVRTWSDIAIETGERWHESIKTRLPNAKVAVLLISPAFLASEYIRNSELPVLLMNARNEGVIILPIILRRCLFTAAKFKYPDPLAGPEELSLSIFQSANSPDKPLNAMQEHEQDEVFVSIAERILLLAKQGRTSSLPEEATPSIWDIPHLRNPFFTGRAQILDHLHRELIATGKAALSLSGMGGVGKTQTAIEYAYRHRDEYRAVLWVKADSEDSLKADFAAIATKLDLPEKDESDRDVIVSAVKRWLEGHSGWLLILDNADDLRLVSGLLGGEWGGHLLLTTRAHTARRLRQVVITEMTPEEGMLFLLRRTKLIALDDDLGAATEADRELAAEITREVGSLPLALDQAGAFIEEMSSSLAEYLELYRREGAQLRAVRGGLIADHGAVSTTFSLAFRQVESASAAAADILRVCAYLAPDAIPEEIFSSGAVHLGDNLATMAGGGINLVRAIGEAGRFSLIRRNAKSGTIQMHRLVQHVLKDEMSVEMRRLWAERVVRGLDATFPQVEHENWPFCERLLTHVQEAARLIEKYGFEFYEATHLLNQAGYFCDERAQYTEAEPLYVQALSIREKALEPDHPHVATSLNNLGMLYSNQSRYEEAKPLLVRALSIREKAYGPDHPDVATSLNNIALLYRSQDKDVEAEPLYVRALSIREKALEPNHPDVANSLNNLAVLYDGQDKFAEAEPLFLRALSIYEKTYGPDHPDMAISLNNLALLYTNQSKYSEAEQLHMRALSIREKMLGPDHPGIATSLNNLALLYVRLKRYPEAEPLVVRALSICERVLGPNHSKTSLARENYATLLEVMQNKTEG
jgi:tetratricopeptide (TPR) repeat protein